MFATFASGTKPTIIIITLHNQLPGGRLVFVECKAPGKPPRADQLHEHERLRTLGFAVVVLDSKNLEGIL